MVLESLLATAIDHGGRARRTTEVVSLASRGARTSSERRSAGGAEVADGRQRRARLGQVDPVVTPDQTKREVV